jgi:hypothetical protein
MTAAMRPVQTSRSMVVCTWVDAQQDIASNKKTALAVFFWVYVTCRGCGKLALSGAAWISELA